MPTKNENLGIGATAKADVVKIEGEVKADLQNLEKEVAADAQELKTMTTDELAASTHPLAPAVPLASPKQDAVAEQFDAASPAPAGASQPVANKGEGETTDGSK